MSSCAHQIDPWAAPPQAVVLAYGGVLAPSPDAPVTQHAITVLSALAEYGLRLVLVSDADVDQAPGWRAEHLHLAGVSWCFDAVLDAAHLGARPPDPRFFAAAVHQIHTLIPGVLASSVAWVDASAAHGITPAIQHGMRAVWVNPSEDPQLIAVPQVRRIETISQLPLALGLPARAPHSCAGSRRTRSPSEGQSGLPRPRRPLAPDRPGNEYS